MTLSQCGKTFLNALLSGLAIGIAGTVYLAVPNANLGSFLFAFALMTILCYGFKLYTGAIGYLVTQKWKDVPAYLLTLFLIWTGNLIGCYAVGFLIRNSRTNNKLCERAASVCAEKLADTPCSLLILSVFLMPSNHGRRQMTARSMCSSNLTLQQNRPSRASVLMKYTRCWSRQRVGDILTLCSVA